MVHEREPKLGQSLKSMVHEREPKLGQSLKRLIENSTKRAST